MQACLLAFTNAMPAVRADLDPALNSISVAGPLPARHRHRRGMCRERGHEPVHLLDCMDVTRAMLMGYYAALHDQHHAGYVADRQARCQLRVICRFLKPGRPNLLTLLCHFLTAYLSGRIMLSCFPSAAGQAAVAVAMLEGGLSAPFVPMVVR